MLRWCGAYQRGQLLRMGTVDAARAVLVARSNDPEVCRQIAALLGSLDHNLSDEQVLEELRAIRAGRPPSERLLKIIGPNEVHQAGGPKRRPPSLFKRRSRGQRELRDVLSNEPDHEPNRPSMVLCYNNGPIYVGDFHYRLGGVRRDLETLRVQGLLSGEVEPLRESGYRYCFGLGEHESLLSLARVPISRVLSDTKPRALVAQHCQAESAVLPREQSDNTIAARNRYFTAAVMRELHLDDVPYFCSFASGCAGFVSLLTLAAGLFASPDERPAICFMADCRPADAPFDMQREKILGSDHSSAFLIGSQPRNYQLLGINYYSTARLLVPLLEVVERSVQMIEELASALDLSLAKSDVVVHYPNVFPEIWKMVTRHLRLPRIEPVQDEMAERAHCGATDSVISLAKLHRNKAGRLHVVVNYGIGLHLAICILKERSTNGGDR